jgi:hypothetical protein
MVLNSRGEESQRYVPSKAKEEEEEEDKDTDTDTDRNYSHTDRLAKESEREREEENWSTKWLSSAKKMRVKREEMMARRGGGARVGSRTRRQASERASEAMASSSCWLSGSYRWATKFQKKRQQEEELRSRRRTRAKKKGDGGWGG